jgi:hypothetical protein
MSPVGVVPGMKLNIGWILVAILIVLVIALIWGWDLNAAA